jgi:hypothetical protein
VSCCPENKVPRNEKAARPRKPVRLLGGYERWEISRTFESVPPPALRKEHEMANALAQMTSPESWKGWKSWKKTAYQGVVKRDWVPTGRIDFATNLNGNGDADQPSEFKLLVEERRIVESIAGNENLEIQWRLATLKEAKAVVTQYHKYLAENSLIKTVFDENTILPPPKRVQSKPTEAHESASTRSTN